MASQIQILKKFPRTELLQEGWAKSRLASSITPSKLNPDTGIYEEGTLPAKLWREPNTGVIMLRPTPLIPEFWEDSTYDSAHMALAKWNFNESSGGETGLMDVPQNDSIHTKRGSATSELIELLIEAAITSILTSVGSEMKWVMQSKDPLIINEGWSVWVHPPGIYTDRAADYMMISFGEKYVLHLKMNGTASLWVNVGTMSSASWVEKTSFQYSGGGVDHNKPFQITVIPFGYEYISFQFSQSNEPAKKTNAGVKTKGTNSYLYEISKHEGSEAVEYDSDTNQWVKTKQGKLAVALRRDQWQYGFAFSKVRYPSTETLTTIPEQIPEVNPYNDPQTLFRGFYGQESADSSITHLSSSFVNQEDAAWNKSVDKQLVMKIRFDSSVDNIYTPELWSYDLEVPEETHTPDWTPEDLSAKWTSLRFQRSVDPDVCVSEFRIENDNFDELFTGWGPVRIKYGTTVVFDGYIYRKQPTIETIFGMNQGTTRALSTSAYSCRDMWLRLNEKYIPDFTFLDGLGLLDTIKKLIKRCGFLEDDIEVVDPESILASLTFEGFSDPNDQKGINQDGTVGDILRDILRYYGPLPIRIRPVDGKWKIYLAPQYDSGTPPAKIFQTFKEPSTTDSDRWAAGIYYIQSNPEFTVEEPFFNGLIARTSKGSADGAEGIQSVIPCGKTDNGIADDTAFWFVGRAKLKIVAPPEITVAQSQIELAKLARFYYDRNSRTKAILEFMGEWTDDIDVDDFIWVQGYNDVSEKVSYGAYRIETIDVESRLDLSTHDTRFSFQASYTCIYVGEASVEDGIQMWTDKLP